MASRRKMRQGIMASDSKKRLASPRENVTKGSGISPLPASVYEPTETEPCIKLIWPGNEQKKV